MYGWRARIGLLVPSVNSCAEPQFQAMAPPGISFYSTRLRLRNGGREQLLAMVEDVEMAASLLADVGADLIVFHCTAGSVIGGAGYDQQIISRIERATGIPAGATGAAVVAGLSALGSKRIALVTPYRPETNDAEVAFLEGYGFSVVSNLGLNLPGGDAFPSVSPEDWYRHVRHQLGQGEDCVFLSCTNIRAVEIIQPIEDDFGVPVITSNQSVLWWVLRKLKLPDALPGYGRLLAKPLDLPVSLPLPATVRATPEKAASPAADRSNVSRC